MNIHLGIAVGVIVLVLVLMGLGLVSFNKGTSWQEKFPDYNNKGWQVEECFGIIAVNKTGAVDYGMTFYRISDKKILGQCSYWISIETGDCVPPKEWWCEFPKNYRG